MSAPPPLPPRADRRSVQPTLVAPLGYPSVAERVAEQVMLVPTLVHVPGRSIGLPVPSSERAADLVMRMDTEARPPRTPISLTGMISDAAGFGANAADAVNAYFGEVHRVKTMAIDVIADQIGRFREAGGKLSEADFRELVAKRSAAQRIIEQSTPPIFRYELIGRSSTNGRGLRRPHAACRAETARAPRSRRSGASYRRASRATLRPAAWRPPGSGPNASRGPAG